MNTFNVIAGFASIIGLALAWNQTFQIKRAVRACFGLDIRRLIERIEKNKDRFKTSDEAAYSELWDVQHELETVDKKLQEVFAVKRRKKAAN